MPLRPVSRDLIAIANNLPSDVPNLSNEDTVKWVLNSNGQFIVASMWNKIYG